MTPDSSSRVLWLKELQVRGFLHPQRSLHNLRRLMEVLSIADAEMILEPALAACDPDLALNGLERILTRLQDAGRAHLLADGGLLSRLALLSGSSDPLAEHAASCLEELGEPGFTEIRKETLEPFAGGDEEDLRRWHRRETLRICLAELEQRLDVEETAKALSMHADRSVAAALSLASEEVSGEQGTPITVIALGKWGGMELNYASDIDLFFLRDDASDPILCEGVARRFLQLLSGGESGERLFRTDVRLRPGGNGGPLVTSLSQAREAFRATADTWERIVHIRTRAAAGSAGATPPLLREIEEFVYERPFDLREIRRLKGFKEILERSPAGRDRERREIKVGWGGIRDVEYVVQFLQLLHGAVYRSIRGGNVFQALRRLGRIGALTASETAFLQEGYRFLRRAEHHLMLRHSRQSFLLPEEEDARRALARGVGHAGWEEFRGEFDRRRDGIRDILDRLLHRLFTGDGDEASREMQVILAFRPVREEIERVFRPLSFRDPHKAYTLLRRLAYPRRKSLQSPRARHFLAHLFPQLLERLRNTPDPDQAVLLFANCVETLGAPATFYQLLAEEPENCSLFVDLFGRSRFLSDLLLDHPGILDEVIDRLRTGEKIVEGNLMRDLRRALAAREPGARGSCLHEFRAVHMLEIAILDLGATIPLVGVLMRLSAVARAALRIIDEQVLAEMVERLGRPRPAASSRPPRHAIIALGRLGGDEMGYASDIDMILIYDGRGTTEGGENEREFYTQHFQRVIATLGNPGSGGHLYPVDLRLRPRGRGGALVHSFREFQAYFRGPESQAWEHQALVRSSPAAGDPGLGAEIMDFVRGNIGRDLEESEIVEAMLQMHQRRKSEPPREGFHLKSGPGGLLDVEFLAQSTILLGLREDPTVWEPNTYRALQLLEARAELPAAEAAALKAAYLFFRLVENRLSMLHRASVRVVPTDDASLRDLALRIGYQPAPGRSPERTLLEEIHYHTNRVQEIFEQRCGQA